MNYIVTRSNDELYHHGVKGMKWGVRRAREHAGPGNYLTRKRQLAGDKRDLNTLNNGGHLSVGLTKKRQAAFDARDKRVLEKRIAKNERANKELSDAKNLYKQQKREIDKAYAKAGRKYERATLNGKNPNKKADDDFNRSFEKWKEDSKQAKADYRKAKSNIKRGIDPNKKVSILDNKKIKAGKKALDRLLNDGFVGEIKNRRQPWDEKPSKGRRGNI